jgi:hypothetical protein
LYPCQCVDQRLSQAKIKWDKFFLSSHNSSFIFVDESVFLSTVPCGKFLDRFEAVDGRSLLRSWIFNSWSFFNSFGNCSSSSGRKTAKYFSDGRLALGDRIS